MFAQPKQRPVAVCTVCGTFGYSVRYIGERCGKPDGGRRCAGIRAAAPNPQDWRQCPRCAGTGRLEDHECHFCLNRGWLYIPRLPAPAQE